MEQWDIGLASWIIQDGNYPDFCRGQEVDFALEFYSDTYNLAETATKSVQPLGHARYRITGEVVYSREEVWVVDFGLLAYQSSQPPSWATTGSFITSHVYLGVDSFFYFEDISRLPGMPPLIYAWIIDQISIQTAPYIEAVDDPSRPSTIPSTSKLLVRDRSRLGYREIECTNAWEDDGGSAEYILHCTKLEHEPKLPQRVVLKQS